MDKEVSDTKQNTAFRFTDEQMAAAKRTDLPDLLKHLGYSVRRVGSRYHTTREMDSIRINTTQVRNMKQYLLTVLYNAPATIENHYAARSTMTSTAGRPHKASH